MAEDLFVHPDDHLGQVIDDNDDDLAVLLYCTLLNTIIIMLLALFALINLQKR